MSPEIFPYAELGAVLLGSYLLGSIPFGLILTHLSGLGDIRKVGSGNIGATNVLRTGNRPLALATLLLDGGKGALAVLLISHLFDNHMGQAAGFAAVMGHIYPIWLRFKGGKGVATAAGTFFAYDLTFGVSMAVVWLSVALAFRYSSLASLVSLVAAPILYYLISGGDMTASMYCLLISLMSISRHKENVQRLAIGQEPRIGQKE